MAAHYTGQLYALQWCHNEHDGISNHQPHDCLLNRLFRHRSKKTSKLRVTGLCDRNSPVTGEFPAQRASNAKNVSIWWRHHSFLFEWRSFIRLITYLVWLSMMHGETKKQTRNRVYSVNTLDKIALHDIIHIIGYFHLECQSQDGIIHINIMNKIQQRNKVFAWH